MAKLEKKFLQPTRSQCYCYFGGEGWFLQTSTYSYEENKNFHPFFTFPFGGKPPKAGEPLLWTDQ
jgi:hypothetical protein